MDDPDSFPALTAWAAVSDDDRREVSRLARQGKEHPDERVAAAARNWAEVLLVDDAFWGEDRRWRRAFAVPGLLLTGEFGFSDWVEHRSEQRWASGVLGASRHQR